MHTTTRRAASVAAALVSLLLVAAPAWAAKPPDAGADGGGGTGSGGGNQGSVKVVDVETGLESMTDNEPHVCGFFLFFDDAPDGVSGTWTIVGWPPTGTGDEVVSGLYVIPPGGFFVTGSMDLEAGHYRLNWQAINAQSEKHKTFWVDACVTQDVDEEQPEEQPEGDVEEAVEEPPTDEEQPDQQPEEPQDPPVEEETDVEQPADPEGDLAPSVTDEPIVGELPDTAMAPPMPVLPGLGAALGLLLLVIAHRLIVDRGRRVPDRT